MVKFKDFSWLLNVFQVVFKANLIFKDFLGQSCNINNKPNSNIKKLLLHDSHLISIRVFAT